MFDITICLIASTDGFFDGVVCFIFVGIFSSFFARETTKQLFSHYIRYATLYRAHRETFVSDSKRRTRSFAQKNQ